MSESLPPIISCDYTDLFRHRSRSYTFDSIAIPIGIDWLGFGWGGVAGISIAVGLGIGCSAVGLPWWIGAALGAITTVVVYALISKDSRGRVSPIERLFIWLDYTFRQPQSIHGTGSDDAPTDLHWQVLLWRPEWMSDSGTDFPPPAQYGITTKGR